MGPVRKYKSMIEATDIFFGDKTVIDRISYSQGERFLRRGLEFFCGKDYIWNESYSGIVDWLANNKSKGLLLIGNCGVGKTLIARNILRPFFNQYYKNIYRQNGREVKFYSAYELETAIEKGLGNCAIIDDIGSENIQTSFGNKVDWFSRAIDYAEQHGCLLICTTNLSSDRMKERYGARTFDRMRAIMSPVIIAGNSLRK